MMTTSPESEFPDRPWLKNSRPLCWDRVPATPTARDALQALLGELEASAGRQRARRPDDRDRLRATFDAIVLDLIVASDEHPERFIAYSRRNDDYTPAVRRYIHLKASLRAVTSVADFLVAAGYAEPKRGSFQRQELGGRGYRSRLRATPKLVSFMAAHGVGLADVGLSDATETIRLRGPALAPGRPKPLLDYEDKPETSAMREGLRRWADVAERHDIQPGAKRWDPAECAQDDEGDGAGEAIELHRVRLYRVFNNGSWSQGGRFYGGWWMTMPSADRKAITIDGEPVVELDFKALHPRMLYHLEGCPLGSEDDPYDLGGAWRDVDRSVIKVAFNQLLAVSPEGGIKKPKDVVLPKGVTYPKLLAALEEKHRPIRRWLRAGKALEMQNLDSRIAERVLHYFTTALGRPVLPVHDSFIVAARDAYKLGETMFLAYRGVMNDRSGVEALPAVKGWTVDVEERVLTTMGGAVG